MTLSLPTCSGFTVHSVLCRATNRGSTTSMLFVQQWFTRRLQQHAISFEQANPTCQLAKTRVTELNFDSVAKPRLSCQASSKTSVVCSMYIDIDRQNDQPS